MAALVFDPARVIRVLEVLPALAQLLPQPRVEGRASAVYSGMRVTERALYRLLANPHYPHLRESLRGVEAAASAGLRLKELRNANLRGDFGSYLQEALLADHFLSRGLTVSKGQAVDGGGNPDLEIATEGVTVTVEVYSPRSWQWREDWLGDVVDTLKYADIPYAFDASVDVTVHGLPVDADLLEAMILATGPHVLTRLTTDLASLDEAAAGMTWTYPHEGRGITTAIEFLHVRHNDTGLERRIGMSKPAEIYCAEPEFDRVLKKIRQKAEKRQVERGAGAVRGLVVDVSRTGVDYEIETARLGLDPAAAARAGIDLDELGLDFIALTVPRRGKRGPKRGVNATVVFENTRVTTEQLRLLFELP